MSSPAPRRWALTMGLYLPANPNARVSASENGAPAPDNSVVLGKARVQP